VQGTDIDTKIDFLKVAEELKLSTSDRADFERKVKDVKASLDSDPRLTERFREAPLNVIAERFPEVKANIDRHFPGQLREDADSSCTGRAPSGAYIPCSTELLQKLVVWIGQSPGHLDAFERDLDVGVDAVAGSAPLEAVVLTKAALRRARQYP
jgi:hypothetical protein